MGLAVEDHAPDEPALASSAVHQSFVSLTTKSDRKSAYYPTLPPPTQARLDASLNDSAFDLDHFLQTAGSKDETVLYLAYGSNLSNETFRGKRGIKPIAQINVQVPSLKMTFDLPGVAYLEPCFANTSLRNPADDASPQVEPRETSDEKSPLFDRSARRNGFRKDSWHKGLIGVVYEVTAKDYAHIIRTEGGGAAYKDILVDCHPFVSKNPSEPVPQQPILPPFKAHTLFAPVAPLDGRPQDGGRVQRPHPGYAQASARYLKLITDGAAELSLPYEYQDYLQSLRPYKITTIMQRLGLVAFLALWGPIFAIAFGMGRLFSNKEGILPKWLQKFTSALFKAAWGSYDRIFKPTFGDGERTIDQDDVFTSSRKEGSSRQRDGVGDTHLKADRLNREQAGALV